MGIILALIFLVLGIGAFAAYGATPHGGPTSTCGPIQFLGGSFTLHADCRYVSAGEIAAGVVFLLLALVTILVARPGRTERP